MEPLKNTSSPPISDEFSLDINNDEDLETTLEKMGPNASTIFANLPSILQGPKLDGLLKQNLAASIKYNFRANFIQKGYDPDNIPDFIKKRIEDKQQLYIDTIFTVFKDRIQEGDSLVDALRAMQKRAYRWINIDDKEYIQDLLSEFGLQSDQQAQQTASRSHIKNVLRAKSKMKNAEITLNIFQNTIDKISKKIILAEEKGCSPSDISNSMIQKSPPQKGISDEEREKLIIELTNEDEQKKSAKKEKNRRPKKATKKKKSGKANRSKPKTPSKFETIEQKPKSKSELRTEYTQALFQRKSKLLPRVKRWSNVKKSDEIRQFTDFDKDGHPVHKYLDLSEKEITLQCIYHNLSGTEKLITDSHDKKVYSFPTNLGCGMMAELILGGRKEFGVIYFGIGKEDGIIFHRYFEKMENAAVLDIFQDQQGNTVADSDDISDDPEWETNAKFEFSVLPDGIIYLTYPGQKHTVRIFPIRKDLLDKSMF